MRILDLFCGAGMVADGLKAAGWDVVGADVKPQPNYPGPFLQHDALTFDPRFLDSFDAIWASPPCLKDTVLYESARREQRAHGKAETVHVDLITPTQRLLDAWAARTGRWFVIENVENCQLLRNPLVLCGSMFDLGAEDSGRRYHLRRHRKIETNWPLTPPPCAHQQPVIGVYGGHARVRAASAGGRGTKEPWARSGTDLMHEAMGVQRRFTGKELDQGIPPAYATWVGEELLAHIYEQDAAAWHAWGEHRRAMAAE